MVISGVFSFLLICGSLLVNHVNADATTWTNFKVRITQDVTGEWSVPLTLDKALQEGYVKAGVHKDFGLINIYCLKDDPRACALYDKSNRFCGFRIGYVINTLSQKCPILSYYHFDKITVYNKETAFGLDYYFVDFIFATPESLKAGGPKTRKEPLGDCLFVKLNGKDWKEIPKKETDILNLKGTVKQACFPKMGQHYFFIDENTDCKTAYPFFVMYNEGKLNAIGMVAFGTVSKNTRDWYEDIPDWFTKMTFTRYPACINDYIHKCGGIGLHMYMTERPEDITCPK